MKRKMIVAEDRDNLLEIIKSEIKKYGNQCSLNHINISKIKNLSFVFSVFEQLYEFNGDISKWDTSQVENMDFLFLGSDFNGDISRWNTSQVKSMNCMFKDSLFKGNISSWDVSEVKEIKGIFNGSKFNGDISQWDVSNVENMDRAFYKSQFTGDLNDWTPINAKKMHKIFEESGVQIPYWMLEDKEQRDRLLRYRMENDKLNKELRYKENPSRKNKI